jgi:kynurenine formamidase
MLNLAGRKNRIIDIKELEAHQEKIGGVEFLLLNTGWGRYWGEPKYFRDYPVLSLAAAAWLAELGMKGIGLDTISADEIDSTDLPVHKAFLVKEILIIENLANLDQLPDNQFAFSCFPLYFENADGSPVRAVAVFSE